MLLFTFIAVVGAAVYSCNCKNVVGLKLAETMVSNSGKIIAETMAQMKKVIHEFKYLTK